jgi:hypothetical protein
MMITAQILSIPPHLSTPWKTIASLQTIPEGERFKLIVVLKTGDRIVIPNLDKPSIDAVFEGHAKYGSIPELPSQTGIAFPLSGNLDLMNSAMQHNHDQANAPLIPPEVLEKIISIAKVLGLEDLSQMQKAEPHCNCPFCQIARALAGQEPMKMEIEEEITEKDLQFRSWDIKQTSDKLYLVVNPLDENEHYSVFLGEPIGCTCGKSNCEHIRAVLNT